MPRPKKGFSKYGKRLGRPPGSKNKPKPIAIVRRAPKLHVARIAPAPVPNAVEKFAETIAASFARGFVRGFKP